MFQSALNSFAVDRVSFTQRSSTICWVSGVRLRSSPSSSLCRTSHLLTTWARLKYEHDDAPWTESDGAACAGITTPATATPATIAPTANLRTEVPTFTCYLQLCSA